jgi:hypothetical protein
VDEFLSFVTVAGTNYAFLASRRLAHIIVRAVASSHVFANADGICAWARA